MVFAKKTLVETWKFWTLFTLGRYAQKSELIIPKWFNISKVLRTRLLFERLVIMDVMGTLSVKKMNFFVSTSHSFIKSWSCQPLSTFHSHLDNFTNLLMNIDICIQVHLYMYLSSSTHK